MAHRITYHEIGGTQPHRFRCRCGVVGRARLTKQQAEDDAAKHRADVERLRLQMKSRNPSLSSQRDYYRQMADNPEVSGKDRAQWKMLADELDIRLGQTEHEWLDEELPFD